MDTGIAGEEPADPEFLFEQTVDGKKNTGSLFLSLPQM